MYQNIAAGLGKLREEEEFWNDAVNSSLSEKALEFNLRHARNAQRAVSEYCENYKSQLLYIKKYPFLAKI